MKLRKRVLAKRPRIALMAESGVTTCTESTLMVRDALASANVPLELRALTFPFIIG